VRHLASLAQFAAVNRGIGVKGDRLLDVLARRDMI
jgi:hypothetical protein